MQCDYCKQEVRPLYTIQEKVSGKHTGRIALMCHTCYHTGTTPNFAASQLASNQDSEIAMQPESQLAKHQDSQLVKHQDSEIASNQDSQLAKHQDSKKGRVHKEKA